MHKHPFRHLAALSTLGLATALSACAATGGATGEGPRPGSEPEPSLTSTTAANAGPFASAPGWSMPAPQPFDATVAFEDLFRPCEDIPDEVLAEVGLQKTPAGGETFVPFNCTVEPKGFTEDGIVALVSWPMGIDAFSHQTHEFSNAGISGLPEAVVMRPTDEFTGHNCQSLVETAVGTIAVMYTNPLAGAQSEKLCDEPKRLLKELFSGGHYTTDH